MAVPAKLYADDRAAIRRSVSLDATVRDQDRRPIDVSIEDLSASGFRMLAPIDLTIGSIVGIGVSGVARRDARVVRRRGSLYGCEFLVPIDDADIEFALQADTVVPALFGDPSDTGFARAPELVSDKLPGRDRVLIIAGTTIALWAIIIGVAVAIW